MKMFRPMFSICSLLEVKLRRSILMRVISMLSRIQSNVSQQATLLLSKLHAWIDKLNGCGMLSVNQFLKISSTFPTEKMSILSPRGIANTKDLKVYKLKNTLQLVNTSSNSKHSHQSSHLVNKSS